MLHGWSGDQLYLTAFVKTFRTSDANASASSPYSPPARRPAMVRKSIGSSTMSR